MKNKVTLYIATHNITGLKYFGKTNRYFTQEDLQKYYHGSGIKWKQHLIENLDDVTMEIYGIYNLDEVENKALTFSLINEIVESELWANLILEDGLDAGGTTGYKHTEETKRKMSIWSKNRKHTDETKKKISDTIKILNLSKNTGFTHSEESKKKMSESHKGLKIKHKPRTKPNKPENIIECPYCLKQGSQGNMKRYHFNNCKYINN